MAGVAGVDTCRFGVNRVRSIKNGAQCLSLCTGGVDMCTMCTCLHSVYMCTPWRALVCWAVPPLPSPIPATALQHGRGPKDSCVRGKSLIFFPGAKSRFFLCVSQVWEKKLENVWHTTYAFFAT